MVEIRAGQDVLTVTRGASSASVALSSATEDDRLAVRLLLAGSRSVRALRVLGAELAAGAERSPGGLALILTDAVVGFLDGDVTAVQRVAERLGKKRVSVRQAREELGCYERWESEVIRAWDDYQECQAVYFGNPVWRDACGLRWMLWAESAWFAFLKCAGSPFITQ
jgi:hypothetical protein